MEDSNTLYAPDAGHHSRGSARASSNVSGGRATRQSAIVRASSVLRASVVSAVDAVGEKIQQGTVMGATLNTLCNVMGAGVLSLPFAMHNGSIAISIVLLFFCGLSSAMSVYALTVGCDATDRHSMNEVLAFALFPPRSQKEYEEETQNNGAKCESLTDCQSEYHKSEEKRAFWRKVVMVAMEMVVILNNYGALIVYARVIADSIPPVIADFLGGSGLWVSKYLWLCLSGAIFFVLSCARNMEELKWTSLLGFITIFYIVVVVVVKYFLNEHDRFVPDTKEAKDIHWLRFGWDSFRTMTTFGVAFGYQYNVPYFYHELENPTPKKMMLTVLFAFPIITICYGMVGIFGYLTYGAMVADEHAGGDIVNNYPSDDVVVNIGRLGLFFHFVSVYPIMSVCVRRGVHRMLCMFLPCAFLGVRGTRGEKKSLLDAGPSDQKEEGERASYASQGLLEEDEDSMDDVPRRAIVLEAFCIVASSAVLAAIVPGIGIVIEVMGSLFGILIMLVGPGLVGIKVFAKNYRSHNFQYFGSTTGNFSPHSRAFYILSWIITVAGVIFMTTGIMSLAHEFATR